MIDVLLSFVEGLALIASPCILPVLPLVLSSSIDGGKARPFGIITGFVLAFSVFVLLSRQIVEVLHIDTDIIRYVSLVLLFGLGLVLLSEKLSNAFSQMTQGAANLGSKFGGGGEGGYLSGVVIGGLIGFVWTPCAGPILAAVLVQVIRQQTNLDSIGVTVAFALGAGIPMFVIALTGRRVMNKFSFLTEHAHRVRQIFAVLILASVVYLGFAPDISSLVQSQASAQTEAVTGLEKGLETPYAAPELVGIQTWINSHPLTLASLKGHVVLIDFWTYSCINCVRTLPYVTAWDHNYRDQGLVIIGVHSPEFEFEKNVDNIKTAAAKYGIQYPIAVDNDLTTWGVFKNQYWPAHYLIDQEGRVVYTHFGEGDYGVTENNIRYLLGLKNKVTVSAPVAATGTGQTQETYLGAARAVRFAGSPALRANKNINYRPAAELNVDQWDLAGAWKSSLQKTTSQNKDASLRLSFNARKVFLVMGSADNKEHRVHILLNGQMPGTQAGKDVQGDLVSVKGHALYELIAQSDSEKGLLEVKTDSPGVEIYAFTFGN